MKYRLNPNLSKVSVTSSTTQEVKGVCSGLSGEIWGDPSDLSRSAGASLKLDMRRLGSGDRIRDFTMKSHIDIAKHPEASFTDLKILSVEGNPTEGLKIRWEGILRYRFKTPKIQGEAILRKEAENRLSADISFSLTLKDINLEPPKFLFLKVSDVTRVEVRIEAMPA